MFDEHGECGESDGRDAHSGVEGQRDDGRRGDGQGVGYDGDGYVRTLHRLGAEGYLRKSASKRELIRALRAIADGQAVYGEEVSRALKTDDHGQYLSLTRKERRILALMAGGMKNREIS